jgi:uridine phosphorylase
MTPYLRPTAAIAEDAFLPGDPGRALALAQALLDKPVMSNHNRGLWGYYGLTAGGHPLTIQATGIGGPSAAAVLSELAELGLRRALRIGSCRALDNRLALGDVVIADRAFALDGTSMALGCSGQLQANAATSKWLRDADPVAWTGMVASVDLLATPSGAGLSTALGSALTASGAVAVDMATAPLMALGERLDVAIGSALIVSEDIDGMQASDQQVESAAIEAGRGAAAALLGVVRR